MKSSTTKFKPVPKGLKLRRYQIEGVKRIVKQQRTLLADECGLGKSCQAVVAANIINPSAILIVCPAVITTNWKREFQAWDVRHLNIFVVDGKKSISRYAMQPVVVVSYDSQKLLFAKHNKMSILELLLGRSSSTSPALLIADEMHLLANWETLRTDNLINKLLPKFHLFIGITGTPMNNRIPDLHPLVSACAPNLFPPFKKFCEEYSTPVWDGYTVNYHGARNLTKLKAKLRTFMIRRYKDEVLKELPDKTYIEHLVQVDEKVAEQSLQYLSYAKKLIAGEDPGELPPLEKKALGTVRRELGLEKIPGIVEYAKLLMDGGAKPLVIFAHHREVIETLEAEFKVSNYRVAKIYGGQDKTYKQKIVDNFQAGELDCVVLSLKAAGVGITLTAASTLMIAELSYVPSDISQAIDRIHRFGQVKGCMIHTCLAEGSLDSKIWQALLNKIRTINKVIGR